MDDERRALLVRTYQDSIESRRSRCRRKFGVGLVMVMSVCALLLGARTVRKGLGSDETRMQTSVYHYYADGLRQPYKGGDVRAACTSYNDDEQYGTQCPPHDDDAWCSHPERTGPGTGFHKVCSKACENSDKAWAMVCAWQAVANLDKVCQGSFKPIAPWAKSNNQDLAVTSQARQQNVFFGQTLKPRTAAGAELYNCDEHAVCTSCFSGEHTTASGGELCERVAAHYGGFGKLDGDKEQESGYTGAEAAFEALSELDKWCEALDATDKELAARRAFGMAPAWVQSFGGEDGVSGEYVQHWGTLGTELVEEHIIRDSDKIEERFSRDAYEYWRYVLADISKLDTTTHIHTSVDSLKRALYEKRVQRGALIFLDVLYAAIDTEHFPGKDEEDTSLAALGWPAPQPFSDKPQEDEDEDPLIKSMEQGCVTSHALLSCQRRLHKECVYQFTDDIMLRSSILRAVLSYDKPLTVILAGDLSCRADLPVTHHQLLFANDAGLVSSVQRYNEKLSYYAAAKPRKAHWFPFGLEGVRILSDSRASALDADSSGARILEPPIGRSLQEKTFLLSVDFSMNRRKPSRNTLHDWLINESGFDSLQALVKSPSATGAGRLPVSIHFVDNRPPYGSVGFASTLGTPPMIDSAEMTRRTVFSVAPAGDFWTSGRVLEALLLNSVPVVDATYKSDGDLSAKNCADPAAFWRHGDDSFPHSAPFIFVEDWHHLPELLAPYTNDAAKLEQLFVDLARYRSALQAHLAALPLALKRTLDAESSQEDFSNTPRMVSSCVETPLDDSERGAILEDALEYYSNPSWYNDYEDSPGRFGVGCTKYTEIRDKYPEYGAICFSEKCAPPLTRDFRCSFHEEV